MILHALTQYYQRKAESDGGVAPEGFENKEIPFIIVIDKQGKFIQLEDTRELKGKKKVGRIFFSAERLGQERFKILRSKQFIVGSLRLCACLCRRKRAGAGG